MSNSVFDFLTALDSVFWGYIAFVLIVFIGCFLSIQSRFLQIREFPQILKTFFLFLTKSSSNDRGVHPLKAFFASVGGMIGIGNVVGIVTAVQIGGPGSLVWVWFAALVGSVIKYSEIFLGLKYRVKNKQGGYDGGPMYFLRVAFNNRFIPVLISLLLCIYGVDVFQFAVITDSISTNFDMDRYLVMGTLLCLILYASSGGVSRIGKICCVIMPFFILLYASMCLWVVFQEIAILPSILKNVFISAFSGHAAVGAFAGSSVALAIQHGISRAAYSADIGIGYDSIIQSESNTVYPERQARLAILGVCVDNLVCTMSILVVLLSGIWKADVAIHPSLLIQTALSDYFPFMHIFMPVFFFIVGYSTLIAFFCVGIKCAKFLFPKYGYPMYMVFGASSFLVFSFYDQSQALIVMSLTGALLLIVNLSGILMLRKEIVFSVELPKEEVKEETSLIEEAVCCVTPEC